MDLQKPIWVVFIENWKEEPNDGKKLGKFEDLVSRFK